MIDARIHHDSAQAPALVAKAIRKAGSQSEVAARCGISRDYLRRLANGERQMSYSLQCLLEQLAAGQ